MEKKKPIQTIIPPSVVELYKFFEDAKKNKQKAIVYGGRGYGKTMLVKMLSRDN